MDLEQVKALIKRARQRIYQELSDLSDDLGPGMEVDVEIDWMAVGTYTDPHKKIPNVLVSARIAE